MNKNLQNYMIVISYDGTSYHGYQFQKNAITVQEVLEKSIKKLYSQMIRVEVAGRTDTGAHARGQVVNFFAPELIPAERLVFALNRVLPGDIVVLEARIVPLNFHSRRDATAKVYSYTIDNGQFPDVFNRNYAFHVGNPLDLAAMKAGASFLLGEHDFKAFQAAGSTVETTKRTLTSLKIEKREPFIILGFEGSGFLYKMVRIITGTLIEVGRGKIKPQDLRKILEGKDRKGAGKTAPAKGLCLEKVIYRSLA
jgi:tRNA pseudouridine38-40 synthase